LHILLLPRRTWSFSAAEQVGDAGVLISVLSSNDEAPAAADPMARTLIEDGAGGAMIYVNRDPPRSDRWRQARRPVMALSSRALGLLPDPAVACAAWRFA
jgi:hypothetical protein